jgi:hypothetical protein
MCECGYSTLKRSNWSYHKRMCMTASADKERIASLEKQLAATNEQMKEQLAAKDEQIKELIQVAKKPRTVHNTTNKYVVEQHINTFGKESIDHISAKQMQALLADPANAVPQFIKMKHRRAPGGVNQNVRVPNQKRAMYQVVVPGEDGEREWENKSKGEALEQLYDDNSVQLEAEADEETKWGAQFLDHQDRVRASAEGSDGGRRYKDQLDKIHCVVSM